MKSFRLLTIAVLAAVTVPRLAHRGMFVDGVTYASIARNLAEGRGSFWSPSYTATLYPQFHEHPPLGFWLQSLWFRVFGDHLFVERLYAVAVALGTAGLIAAIWRRLHADVDRPTAGSDGPAEAGHVRHDIAERGLDWLPVVLWIAVPVVSWAIVGNLLETTVALFTTGAILAALNASSNTGGGGAATGWTILSGLCIVAAVLTKGPVGFFPLVLPIAFLWLAEGRQAWRAILVQSALQWMTVAACAWLVWTSGTARASLTDYANQQVMAALAGSREVSGSSVTILKTLMQGVVLPMTGVAVLAFIGSGRFVVPAPAVQRRALLFLAVGLSGTLPILASAKQAGHYLVPAVPLYAIAAALVVGPTVAAVVHRSAAKPWRVAINIAITLLILGTVGGSLSAAVGRDRDRLADLDAMASTVPRTQTIGLCPESNDDWGLHAWFQRRFQVSLDAGEGRRRDWFLQTARGPAGCVPAACAAATDPRRQLVLMKCRRAD